MKTTSLNRRQILLLTLSTKISCSAKRAAADDIRGYASDNADPDDYHSIATETELDQLLQRTTKPLKLRFTPGTPIAFFDQSRRELPEGSTINCDSAVVIGLRLRIRTNTLITGGTWIASESESYGGMFEIGTASDCAFNVRFEKLDILNFNSRQSYAFDIRLTDRCTIIDCEYNTTVAKKSLVGMSAGKRVHVNNCRAFSLGADGDDFIGTCNLMGDIEDLSITGCYIYGFFNILGANSHNYKYKTSRILVKNCTAVRTKWAAVLKPGWGDTFNTGGGIVSDILISKVTLRDTLGERLRGIVFLPLREENGHSNELSDVQIEDINVIGRSVKGYALFSISVKGRVTLRNISATDIDVNTTQNQAGGPEADGAPDFILEIDTDNNARVHNFTIRRMNVAKVRKGVISGMLEKSEVSFEDCYVNGKSISP